MRSISFGGYSNSKDFIDNLSKKTVEKNAQILFNIVVNCVQISKLEKFYKLENKIQKLSRKIFVITKFMVCS